MKAIIDSKNLSDFFSKFKNICFDAQKENKDSIEELLSKFFCKYLFIIQSIPEEKIPSLGIEKKEVDTDCLEKFFSNLQIPLDNANKYGFFCDPWAVAGLRRDEVRNAKVLAWFLSPRGTHGMGGQIYKYFLEIVSKKLLYKLCKNENENLSKIKIFVESCPDGLSNNRVDIEIDGEEFFLIVEVKIDAPEGPDQINRYCQIAKERANGRSWSVVYLTPEGRAVSSLDAENEKNVVRLSWREIGKVFSQAIHNMDLNTFAHNSFLAKKFVAHIQRF